MSPAIVLLSPGTMARPVAPGTSGLSSASNTVAELFSVYGEELDATGDCAAADGEDVAANVEDVLADGDDVSPHPARHSIPVSAIRVLTELFMVLSPLNNQRHSR